MKTRELLFLVLLAATIGCGGTTTSAEPDGAKKASAEYSVMIEVFDRSDLYGNEEEWRKYHVTGCEAQLVAEAFKELGLQVSEENLTSFKVTGSHQFVWIRIEPEDFYVQPDNKKYAMSSHRIQVLVNMIRARLGRDSKK